MDANELARRKAAAAYNAAADHYDLAALSFWSRFSRRTVERLALRPGSHVLDAACGTGASLIPAAQAVGPTGKVVGVDLAENLLERAREKCATYGLTHVELRQCDFAAVDPALESFDAVVCVFGIFFVPDMPGAVRHLWQLLRPGGTLAITTWGPNVFEPANSAFWEAVRDERPDLYKSFNPWDLVCEPAALKSMLAQGGVGTNDVVAESGEHPIERPEDWWTIVMGSGYRGTVEQLDAAARARVRDATLAQLRQNKVRRIDANVVYAIATK